MERIEMKMSLDMLHVAGQIAAERDITIGQLVRDLVAKEIERRKNARPPNRADEHLVAPLRARLAPDFAEALDWRDLDSRLRAKDFELRPAGGGLALHRHSSGERLCKASELGFSYSKLIERFQAGFPGHSHTWIEARLIPGAQPDPNALSLIDDDDW